MAPHCRSYRVLLAFAIFALHLVTAQFTCSSSQPCSVGCCSNFGSCGLGLEWCGAGNCTSDCNRKSECDPGWGSQWSASEACPLNVCCSKYGFCGTTEEFCGDTTVTAPSCASNTTQGRTIGYYEGWSIDRPCDKMYPEAIDVTAYTHLLFSLGSIDPTTFSVAFASSGDAELNPRLTGLKAINPDLQVWISIGGWSFNDPDQATATTFSDLAGSTTAQQAFSSSLISFLETYGFDGVGIDWEYPVAPERSGKPEDYENYVTFLQAIRNAFVANGKSYGLSITLPSSYWYMRNFDIVSMVPVVDWFNVMTYDLHGTWDAHDQYIGPYVYAHTNLTEIDNTMNLLWRNNIPPSSVNLGLGFYGRSYTLADPACTLPGCMFSGPASAGKCTQAAGTLSDSEIQDVVNAGAVVSYDPVAAVKYAVWNSSQWVSYDDFETIQQKIAYANSHCLGGTFVWAVSLDSQNTTTANSDALSAAVGASRLTTQGQVDPILACSFTSCDVGSCPSGTIPLTYWGGWDAATSGMYIQNTCANTKVRSVCCPPSNLPQCIWRGGEHAWGPFNACAGKCQSDEVYMGSTTSNVGGHTWCSSGHKVLCCKKSPFDTALTQQCYWDGAAPNCGNPVCSKGSESVVQAPGGPEGSPPCADGGVKTLCCNSPSPYTNCNWFPDKDASGACSGHCPPGQYSIATNPLVCNGGYESYCCDAPVPQAEPQNPIVANFVSMLQNWAANPTCPYAADSPAARRLLRSRSSSHRADSTSSAEILRSRDLDVSMSTQLDALIVALCLGKTSLAPQLQLAFTQYFTEPFQAACSDFTRLWNSWQNADPTLLTSEFRCEGHGVMQALQDSAALSSNLCTPTPPACSTKREDTPEPAYNDSKARLFERTIENNYDINGAAVNGDGPSLGYVINGILNGRMMVRYARLIRLPVNAYREVEDNIVEIVWDLPLGGNYGIDPSYQEFGFGNDPHNLDRFAVFHFHIDHILEDCNGRRNVAMYAIVAFHGQDIINPLQWNAQVDGRDNPANPLEQFVTPNERNRRTHIMACNADDAMNGIATVWYPGLEYYPMPNDNQAVNLMTQFGTYLLNQQLLDANQIISDPNEITLGPADADGRRAIQWAQPRWTLSHTWGQDTVEGYLPGGDDSKDTPTYNEDDVPPQVEF